MSSLPADPPTTAASTRCQVCRARLQPDDGWCSLCHTQVRATVPAPDPVPVPRSEAGPGNAVSPVGTEGPVGTDGPVGTAGPVGTGGPVGTAGPVGLGPARELPPEVAAAANRLLAELGTAAEQTRRPGLGPLPVSLGPRSGGAVVAVIGGVLLMVVVVLGLTLLGMAL